MIFVFLSYNYFNTEQHIWCLLSAINVTLHFTRHEPSPFQIRTDFDAKLLISFTSDWLCSYTSVGGGILESLCPVTCKGPCPHGVFLRAEKCWRSARQC